MEFREHSEVERLYQTYRAFLFGLAYRMLGSAADAEDVVHDVFIQLQHVQLNAIRHPKSYLAKMVHHKCLDLINSARYRRESYVGQWLPEPLVTDSAEGEPEKLAIQGELLSLAMLTLLEQLSPMERAVFVLREAFDFSYTEVAGIVGKTEESCRQTVSRIKRKLQPTDRPIHVSEQTESLVKAFISAVNSGRIEMLLERLAEDVVLYTDGGGQVRSALNPIFGRDRLIQYFSGLIQKAGASGAKFELIATTINGESGVASLVDGRLYAIIGMRVTDHTAVHLYAIYNPDKLAYAARQLQLGLSRTSN